MKKIVPFKKDIEFNNSIAEISSISLEHTLKLQEENLVSGEFIISGTYKMTEASLNVDPFEYKLPFDISIDKKYDTEKVNVDINDFYYEVINNEILSINIEIVLDNLEEKQIEKEVVNLPEEKIEVLEDREELDENISENNVSNQEVKNIFSGLEDNERYYVYKVHIVTENDTVESIMQKYDITRENLEAYNDLNNLKIGDKLIIPSNEN